MQKWVLKRDGLHTKKLRDQDQHQNDRDLDQDLLLKGDRIIWPEEKEHIDVERHQ